MTSRVQPAARATAVKLCGWAKACLVCRMRKIPPLAALALLFAATSALAAPAAPGAPQNGSFTVGPNYTVDPVLTDLGAAKGRWFRFSMPLAQSRIFRGDDLTLTPAAKPVNKERQITVYVPAAYRNGDRAPVLVIHDGPAAAPTTSGLRNWIELTANALDNLTGSRDPARRLPAFVAVAVQNGGNDGKSSQRGLEYDTLSDREARFIHDEVLAAVEANAEIRAAYPRFALTRNPDARAVAGCSSGGAAALTMGWFRPDWFRRIIAYSGTFVDQQDDDAPEEARFPYGAWEYHSGMKLIESSPKKPLRIFTHVSEQDLRFDDPEDTQHNWVMAGKRTAEALAKKGYDQRFVFSLASRHCDPAVVGATLADTLVWTWAGLRN